MAYKTIKFKDIEVYYTNELNGGGLTFGQDYLDFLPRFFITSLRALISA